MSSIKYTRLVLEQAVKASTSYANVLRTLGLKQAGGTQTYIKRCIQSFKIDTSHFKGSAWNKNVFCPQLKPEEILVRREVHQHKQKTKLLRRALLSIGRSHVCDWCGLHDLWNGKPIVLEIDHIDGDFLNNEATNLRFLCPNCHTQTPTHHRRK